jgi:hypothetical protein
VKRGEPFDAPSSVRAIEAFVRERGGFTNPWADIIITPEELEANFDH